MDKFADFITRLRDNKKYIKIAVVILIIASAVFFFGAKGKDDSITIEKDEVTQSSEKEPEDEEDDNAKLGIYVDVAGEVKSPGVYSMDEGSRVFDVIEKAGGLTNDADIENINRAEPVADGQKITVPSKNDAQGGFAGSGTSISASDGENNRSGSSNASNGNSSGLVNINSADSAQLQMLPGVGPATAEKIITYREQVGRFKRKEDIKDVNGIGEKKYAKMEALITV